MTLPGYLFPPGIEIRPIPSLGKKPRRERERFSGGVNVSAQKRNAEALSIRSVFYQIEGMPQVIFCAPWVAELVAKAASGAFKTV